MKALNLFLAVLFVVFAFVQVNDPDPAVWITIYGLMAVACVLAAFGHYYPKVLALMALVFFAYSFTYFAGVMEWLQADDKSVLFDNLAKMQFRYVEESREFLGLFICIAVLVLHLVSARRQGRRIFR